MKKFILLVIFGISFLLFLPQITYSQTGPECMKIFDKEMKDCTTEFNACQAACMEKTKKPDGSAYFNSGEIFSTCSKESDCNGKSGSCRDQALTNYKACGKPGEESEAKTAKEVEPSWLEFLGINPYQTWLRLQETVEVAELYVSGELGESLERIVVNPVGKKTLQQMDESKEQQLEAVFGKDWRAQLDKINNDIEVSAWKIPVPTGESVVDVPGTTDVKRYSWDVKSGAVIRSNTWETVTFKEPVVTDDVVTRTVKFKEGDMEVKVKNEKPTVNRFAVDANGFFDLFVIQTHFRMSYTPEKKLAVISVYEGEVEIKTKDGQTVKLKPDGGKPGVLVVSKKLSPVKLAIGGLALFAITGGIVWFLKRKTSG